MLPPTVRLLYLGRFFVALRFFAAIQVIYFTRVTGSYALATSLFAASTIAQAGLELPTGVFADSLGRSRTAILASLAALGSVTLYALGGGYWILLAGAVVEGLARALASGNGEALLYDALRDTGQEGRYHHSIGRLGAIEAASFGFAALAGGVMASRSIGLALWLSVLTQALALAVALRLAEPASTSRATLNPYGHLREAVVAFKRNPRLRLLTLAQTWSEPSASRRTSSRPSSCKHSCRSGASGCCGRRWISSARPAFTSAGRSSIGSGRSGRSSAASSAIAP